MVSNLFKITTKQVKIGRRYFILLKIEDLIPELQTQLATLRRTCQKTLVNALSHESFTPLNKIMSMTELIMQKAQTVEQCKKQIALVQENCERMRFLIQSQIYQYKFESGLLNLNQAPLNRDSLERLVSAVQKPFDAELQLKNLKITASFDHADTGNLSTDWSVFQCSLFHLLSNAIKHGKQGSSIQIDVAEKEGLLVFAITNFCETLSLKGWEKAMSPVFAFERLSVEVNET